MRQAMFAPLCLAAMMGLAATSASLPAADEKPAGKSPVKHGEYLVHQVAMCIYCHTPKNSAGNLNLEELLAGAPIPVGSPYPSQTWGFQAPNLRALPAQWGQEPFVQFLQTGKTPNGYSPRYPMPPYRMNREDAEAVAAYLNSLKDSR